GARPGGGKTGFCRYDGLGNGGLTSEPGGLEGTRTFDAAGRLRTIATSESGGRAYLTNTYDEPGHGSSAGKLTSRVANNWTDVSAATVTDSFNYSGLGGRLSES